MISETKLCGLDATDHGETKKKGPGSEARYVRQIGHSASSWHQPETPDLWDLEDKEKERRRRRHGAVIRSVASGHVLSVAGMDYLSGEGGNFHPVGSHTQSDASMPLDDESRRRGTGGRRWLSQVSKRCGCQKLTEASAFEGPSFLVDLTWHLWLTMIGEPSDTP